VNNWQKAKGKRQTRPGAVISFTFYVLPFTLVLALALRLLLWSAPLHLPANDEVEYIAVARDLLAGRGWQFYDHYHWLRAPLYPLFLAASLWLAGGDLHAAALPNIALSVATVYLNYRLAMALFGQRTRVALLAALISAILWTFATFASLYMSETLFTFLFTGALLCLFPEQRTGTRRVNSEQGPTNDEPGGKDHQFRAQKRDSYAMTALAGILFGLATLARSITLLFLPVVALWLLLRTGTRRDNREQAPEGSTESGHPKDQPRTIAVTTRRAVLCSFLFVLCSLLVIAPWTIRNYQAYGRAIVVDTGLSYNLWAFNEPRESTGTIFRTLENIANPAERSDYATAKGLARLREDPAILLRKLWPNWVYLWRVKAIEDRFIQEDYHNDVDLPLFTSALIFDDLLYFVVALAGVAGLVLYRGRRQETSDQRQATQELRTENQELRTGTRRVNREPRAEGREATTNYRRRTVIYNLQSAIYNPKWLLIAWLLYTIGTVLVTHGEGRYRHFLFPVLIPYAAWALVRIANWRINLQYAIYNLRSTMWSPVLRIGVIWALVGGTFLISYPWDWASQNLVRGWYATQAELAWARGDHAAAFAADEQALAAQETPDGWLRLAAHAHAAGDPRRARNAYNAARTLARTYLPGVAQFGDFLRASGDETRARAVFDTDDVDPQRLLDWSWRELRPAPRARLEIGDGLDWGYIVGAYPAETIQDAQARWTNGAAHIRFGVASTAGNRTNARTFVQLRLAAFRPNRAPVTAQICASEQCWDVRLTPTWRSYTVAFDVADDAPLIVELRSDTFDAADGRRLGVLIDGVELKHTVAE